MGGGPEGASVSLSVFSQERRIFKNFIWTPLKASRWREKCSKEYSLLLRFCFLKASDLKFTQRKLRIWSLQDLPSLFSPLSIRSQNQIIGVSNIYDTIHSLAWLRYGSSRSFCHEDDSVSLIQYLAAASFCSLSLHYYAPIILSEQEARSKGQGLASLALSYDVYKK